ncbi:MAG: outer membrane insertion C-terminal signal domain protein [Caudoviricetes sp.]|nr:MAG: outer membrane insertion C-terminal signal domain protein [Caudoviricetes sp.]
MNKNNKIWQVLGILALALLFYFLGGYFTKEKITYKDRIKVVKTLEKEVKKEDNQIKEVEKKVTEYKKERKKLQDKEKEIVYPKEQCDEIVDNLKKQLENCDTIVKLKDTIIYKERLKIEYKDRIIDNMVIDKPKRFGIGIQAGYGTNGKEFYPTISVGVSYNLIRF